ncbi:hypothetical protein MMC26_006995 [Xylographa opegraphella]|nr:hypothetical protein [Xylographa opegraphella]
MRFSTITILSTATFAGLAPAQSDDYYRHLRKRGPIEHLESSAPAWTAMKLPLIVRDAHLVEPAPSPPDREGPPPQHPNPGARTDAVSHSRRKREPEPDFVFGLYARDFGYSVAELYACGLRGDLELDERDLDAAFELYEQGFGENYKLDE